MLLYGNLQNARLFDGDSKYTIFNLCSFAEKYERLNLMPPNNLGALNEYDYDVKFFHWVMDIDEHFVRMFQVVLQLYNGSDVYLVTEDEDWTHVFTESFLKILQQRYGLAAVNISSNTGNSLTMFDDLLYANESRIDPTYGMMNFDSDLSRYQYIVSSNMLKVDPYVIQKLESEV